MSRALRFAASLVFPTRCCSCDGRSGSDPYLCAACRRCLTLAPSSLSLPYAVELPVRAALILEGPARDLVHVLKYSGRTGIARRYGPLLANLTREAPSASTLVWVPLHWQRRWWRGYDQAERLASAIARERSSLRTVRALRRRRSTDAQVGLSGEDRQRNLRGAFVPSSRSVAGRKCILVDDVVTTGATIAAAWQALREARARPVLAVALAVSPRSVLEIGTTAVRPPAPVAQLRR